MITINYVEIFDTDDYNKLKDNNIINQQYIDDSIVDLLKKHVGVKCKVIAVEYPYYDNDYLSSYYALYAKKHKDYSKKCYRLLFFSDTTCDDMIGYITLRPTAHGTHLCKTMFEPRQFLTENASLILSQEKVHYLGGECVLNLFPQIGQEGAVSACAHVSVWSILRSFANRFQNFGTHRIADIATKTIQFERKNIPTAGLTIVQISNLFTQFGFSPEILKRESANFDDAIISYLESSIPMVGIMLNRSHAIAITGICDKTKNSLPDTYINKVVVDETEYEIALHSKLIPGIFVNDDHSFPYGMVKKYVATGEEKGVNVVPYLMSDIEYVIIPLHHRIYLRYHEACTFFFSFFEENAQRLKWPRKFVTRVFLVSSNRYKEYTCSEASNIERVVGDTLLAMETPKFMWCFEITQYDKTDKDKIDHIMLLDSTATLVADDPVLFLSGSDFIEFKDGDTFKHIDVDLSQGIEIKSFDNLLEKVEYEYEQD